MRRRRLPDGEAKSLNPLQIWRFCLSRCVHKRCSTGWQSSHHSPLSPAIATRRVLLALAVWAAFKASSLNILEGLG